MVPDALPCLPSRASVDVAALEKLIDYARDLNERVIQEFCVGPEEDAAARRELEDLAAALRRENLHGT